MGVMAPISPYRGAGLRQCRFRRGLPPLSDYSSGTAFGIVDGVQQCCEFPHILNGYRRAKAAAQQIEVRLGKKSHGDDIVTVEHIFS